MNRDPSALASKPMPTLRARRDQAGRVRRNEERLELTVSKRRPLRPRASPTSYWKQRSGWLSSDLLPPGVRRLSAQEAAAGARNVDDRLHDLSPAEELHRDEIEPANPIRGSNETFGVTRLLVSQLQHQIASENEIDSFDPGRYG